MTEKQWQVCDKSKQTSTVLTTKSDNKLLMSRKMLRTKVHRNNIYIS